MPCNGFILIFILATASGDTFFFNHSRFFSLRMVWRFVLMCCIRARFTALPRLLPRQLTMCVLFAEGHADLTDGLKNRIC